MLKYAIIFAIISVIAGALGFGGVASGAAGIAKLLFGLFLVIALFGRCCPRHQPGANLCLADV